MVIVRKGLSDHVGLAYTGLRSEADVSCSICQNFMCNTLKVRGSCICFPKPLHRTCTNTIWGYSGTALPFYSEVSLIQTKLLKMTFE